MCPGRAADPEGDQIGRGFGSGGSGTGSGVGEGGWGSGCGGVGVGSGVMALRLPARRAPLNADEAPGEGASNAEEEGFGAPWSEEWRASG
jgi:hypothetical protein